MNINMRQATFQNSNQLSTACIKSEFEIFKQTYRDLWGIDYEFAVDYVDILKAIRGLGLDINKFNRFMKYLFNKKKLDSVFRLRYHLEEFLHYTRVTQACYGMSKKYSKKDYGW